MSTRALNTLYNTIRYALPALAVLLVAVTPISAASTELNPLLAASASIETLVQRVSGSVVQIVVTGLQPVGGSAGETPAVGRARSIGSGFVIDRGGYIVTNAHVVRGAERVDVIVSRQQPSGAGARDASAVLSAVIVGVVDDWDLALLKVDADLAPLPLADYDAVRQGQLVFAFGSPDGLRNSVTMGMVSAVARQMEPDSPLVYIQTDAAINPGSSGGPLVNARGEVIGVDTFIRSAAGGSDGLGFAIPSSLIALAYPQLREHGRLRRAVIGISTQMVTAPLALGLGLAVSSGLIVSDLVAGGPAAQAGLRIGDVITAIDGAHVDNVEPSRLYLQLASLRPERPVALTAMRGAQSIAVTVQPREVQDGNEAPGMVNTGSMLIAPLSILALPFDAAGMAGVVVAARLDTPHAAGIDLAVGDVIVSANGRPVRTVPELRDAIAAIPPQSPVVLHVAREGRLSFVTLTRD